MKSFLLLLTLSATCLADQPTPQYVAPQAAEARQDQYGSPEAAPQEAAPTPDTYGAPQAPVVDSYGSPQAPVVSEPDAYGAPAAPVISEPAEAAPVGNQGYYYYYYPVKQGGESYEAEEEESAGLLGGLLSDGLLGTLVTKKILLVVLGIGAFLLVTALGIQVNFGRSLSSAWEYAGPHMTEDNLITLADFVSNSIAKYK